MSNLKCPICNSSSNSFYTEVYDDRYGYPGRFKLYKCNDCQHVYLDEKFDSETLTSLYTDYYPRSNFNINNFKPRKEIKGFGSWFKGEHRSAYTYVPKNVRVLDVGCGFGETLAYHKQRGCEVYGCEVDQNIERVAEEHGFNVHVGLYDSANYEENFFDYITLDQVIEHVTDPIEILKGISYNLKTGGTAILSCPNVNGWGASYYKNKWLHWHTPYHLHFFSKKSMRDAAKKAGMIVVKVKYAALSDWLYWQWVHILFMPKINEPSLFWKYMTRKKYSASQIESLNKIDRKKKYRINDVITRILDLMGLGDNYVFILKKI
jgi:2-polyprenyl-3-methyl-5-hydroxy-6-metoxy-1,4-benzoquinol methylase